MTPSSETLSMTTIFPISFLPSLALKGGHASRLRVSLYSPTTGLRRTTPQLERLLHAFDQDLSDPGELVETRGLRVPVLGVRVAQARWAQYSA